MRDLMQCDQHSEKKAVAVCLGCSKALCDDCTLLFEGKNICKECEQKLEFILDKNSVTDNLDGIEEEITNRVNFGKEKLEKLIKEEKLDEEFKKFMNEANEIIFGFVNVYEMNEIKRDNQNGFLICVECNGYYELHEGESLKDFECCECGGTLKFNKNLPADDEE
jgi:hypothetical protein